MLCERFAAGGMGWAADGESGRLVAMGRGKRGSNYLWLKLSGGRGGIGGL